MHFTLLNFDNIAIKICVSDIVNKSAFKVKASILSKIIYLELLTPETKKSLEVANHRS